MQAHFAQNAPLARFTSYRIGGKAKYLAGAYDTDSLMRAMELSERRLILGMGSKILVSDKGFDGVVILMRDRTVKITADGVYASAGAALPAVSRFYLAHSLTGMEWACGIPGSVGGAIKMNAGAFGGDISRILIYADVLKNERIVRLDASECGFGYRFSAIRGSDVVIGALFKAVPGDSSAIEARHADFAVRRSTAQPNEFSCGSVFKAGARPAWEYIDSCGLKGIAAGDAQISGKHANFIVNKGGASARDIVALIRTAKAEVFIKHAVMLKEEIVYAGDFL